MPDCISELKILEWNIRGSASMGWNNKYEIKKFVVDRIMSEEADIVIINEFVISKGWDYFQLKLEEYGYVWFMTHTTSQNGILIAINKNIDGLDLDGIKKYEQNKITTEIKSKSTEKPDFLQVELKISEKIVYVIGIRIIVGQYNEKDYKDRKKQLDSLIEHLSLQDNENIVIIAGDFNNSRICGEQTADYDETVKKEYVGKLTEHYNYHIIKDAFKEKAFTMYTPEGEEFSWGGYIKNDHIICKGVKNVNNLEYSKDCMESESKSKSPIGYPDHAILSGTIEFND